MSLETQLGYIYRAPFLILLVVFEQIFDSDGCTLNIRHVFFREKSQAKNVTASSGQTEENRREKRTQESFITLMHFVANVLSICAVSVPVPLSSNLFNFVFASFNSLPLLVLRRRITFSWRYTVCLYSSYICTVLILKKGFCNYHHEHLQSFLIFWSEIVLLINVRYFIKLVQK